MASILHRLPRTVLEELSRALGAGRVLPPYTGLAVREWVGGHDSASVATDFERLRAAGMTGIQLGIVLELLATERARQQDQADRLQMVWTGPDQEGASARDTGVVARELLGEARRSLLIATFSISRGTTIFEPVIGAMMRNPDLEVTLVLHIDVSRRGLYGDAAVSAFAREFWRYQWPWSRRPAVYFDPRGVREDAGARANQHAKCVVADGERVLITSANYTEWAQERNIELGVVIRDQGLAQRVEGKFRGLIQAGALAAMPAPVFDRS